MEPAVQADVVDKNGNLGEVAQEKLSLSYEFTDAQKSILNTWWVHIGIDIDTINWVDLLDWIIDKVIEWISDLLN